MKFLVIGLGSMGKRRIRCLKTLGYKSKNIYGFDLSGRNVVDACHEYSINGYYSESDLYKGLLEQKIDLVLVCVPPTKKQNYIKIANTIGATCFCEADIQSYEGQYYPSRTLVYHPAIKQIKRILNDNILGKLYTFNYHMGQHIRDWHPGADYSNYYAAKKNTGACREMFCFELSWLSWLLGKPIMSKGLVDKQLEDSEIKADDLYSSVVSFEKGYDYIIGTMLIEILARPAIRELTLIGEKGTLVWDWNYDHISVYTDGCWEMLEVDKGNAHEGYNKNIPEQMYVDELSELIKDVEGKGLSRMFIPQYSYSKKQEEEIINMLRMVENS